MYFLSKEELQKKLNVFLTSYSGLRQFRIFVIRRNDGQSSGKKQNLIDNLIE